MTYFAWFVFICAAIFEVGGDAVVRKGLRGNNLIIVLMGCVMLGSYGVVVNTVKWNFSKLLGCICRLLSPSVAQIAPHAQTYPAPGTENKKCVVCPPVLIA